MTNNELQHHGIIGMKWGVRRYQNKDGSYTQAGLKRYREAKDNYNTAKKDYKNKRDLRNYGGDLPDGTNIPARTITKKEVRDAYFNKRQAGLKLDAAASDVRRAVRADKGKELYEKEGKSGEDYRLKSNTYAINAGIQFAIGTMLKKHGKTPYHALMSELNLGGAALNAAASIVSSQKHTKLSAYEDILLSEHQEHKLPFDVKS